MRLTTKGRYTVTAMLDLALRADADEAVALADISIRQGISLAYLEQLFAKLRRSKLVVSTRGPGGGYRLARAAQRISVADIIAAIDENIDVTRCRGSENCRNNEACLTHQLWEDLTAHIRGFLQDTSLADLAERPHVKEVSARQASRARAIGHVVRAPQ